LLDCPITNDSDRRARLGIKVVSSGTSTTAAPKTRSQDGCDFDSVDPIAPMSSLSSAAAKRVDEPFLRVPPFPGAHVRQFRDFAGARVDVDALADGLRRLRVGGSYWGARPGLPTEYVLVRPVDALSSAAELANGRSIVLWGPAATGADAMRGVTKVSGDCDPWHMLRGASALVAEPHDELRLIAALCGVPCHDFDSSRGICVAVNPDTARMLEPLSGMSFENPFKGGPMDSLQTAELCGFWRSLIDSNRDLAGGIGFAFWKQAHVAPLLWGGMKPFEFLHDAGEVKPAVPVAVWRAKAPSGVMSQLKRRGNLLIEVEDGFLRSRGLGADCIPPLSITVDRLGPHFDPSCASELELLLQSGRFDEPLIERARELRRLIVEAGIGKYGRGTAVLDRPGGKRRHILVPGQVEDDRAVEIGGCGLASNLELLARVREQAPDAYILYKPHPDVIAGHRRGAIPDSECLRYADGIVGDLPIASLIAMADEVHVNTSQAGFEALLRGKAVTTYGVPFYAGWGLTKDLGPVPVRRSTIRTIDELVAATLLLYPRYLDPVTGLPCPAEIVVSRLCASDHINRSFIVGIRRMQGKVMRHLRRLVQ
jgi:capsular polysaccharide export protein